MDGVLIEKGRKIQDGISSITRSFYLLSCPTMANPATVDPRRGQCSCGPGGSIQEIASSRESTAKTRPPWISIRLDPRTRVEPIGRRENLQL